MSGIEFLRYGSQIPGFNHGCCALDIIQNFGCDPDGLASIQVTNGDQGTPCTNDGKLVFLGPTNLDVFKQRLRIGTFFHRELPNHAFLAIITGDQLEAYDGIKSNAQKWLAILKEHGFEFIRAWHNSVYSSYRKPVYLFGLFRNIAEGRVEDQFKPPEAWTKLPENKRSQQEIWDSYSLAFMSEEELRAKGAPVYLAGLKRYDSLPKLKAPEEVVDTETADPEDDILFDEEDDILFDEEDDLTF